MKKCFFIIRSIPGISNCHYLVLLTLIYVLKETCFTNLILTPVFCSFLFITRLLLADVLNASTASYSLEGKPSVFVENFVSA